VKLGSVVSDVLGASGRRIVEAIIAGQRDAERLAASLYGRITDHHRFMLRQHLHTIDGLQATVRAIEERIEECLRPFCLPGREVALVGAFETADRERHHPVCRQLLDRKCEVR
jgi:hypothetical protein